MILIKGYFRMAKGAVPKIEAAMRAQVAACRAEEGCIDYAFSVDVMEPDVVRVSEAWENWDALKAHGKQPHMATWRAAQAEAGLEERSITGYEVGEGRKL